MMNGSGCKNCPVKPCYTLHYRGSYCAEQRAKHGLGDPQTNEEKIRAMTAEELEEFLRDVYDTGSKSAEAWYCGEGHRHGFKWTEEWLKQPAENQ